jgi:NAD(P)H-flavin reductase/ferredoxin
MTKTFNVSVREQLFTVPAGGRLLDAALQNGVDLPHDCRAGQCGACTIELTQGITLGGEVGCGNILACQARVFSNLIITPHDAPEPMHSTGVIEEIRHLAADVVKLIIKPRRPILWLPGQYMKLQFGRFPARSFSPTAKLADGSFDDRLTFHIKQVRDGLVTPKLGKEIAESSKVSIEGPFGHAFLRDDHAGRIVLLGSGTGFAPIWAIAAAARKASATRSLVLICGARSIESLYMQPALHQAHKHPQTRLQIVLENRHAKLPTLPCGTPADHMPALTPDDVVFAAGSPRMVEKARERARLAGARFYADAFTSQSGSRPGAAAPTGLGRLARLFAAT